MRPKAIRRPEPTSPPTTPRDKGRGATANEPEPHPQAGGAFRVRCIHYGQTAATNHVFCGLFE
jgi:hypothetical protein